MSKKVKVTANESGVVIVASSNNPEFGYVRLTQDVSKIVGGWLRPKTLSTLISGAVADLKAEGYSAGMEMEGKIYAVETFEPTNPDNVQQDVKMAGDSGIACSVAGRPIYRKTYYTEDLSVVDTLLAHDNGEAIKAHYASKEAAGEDDAAM
ncbi:MAG: hypothetical protein ACW98X_22225 [Promethearchaeota archaeon]|jgi:hypothetical protein